MTLRSGVDQNLGAVNHRNLVSKQPDGTFKSLSDITNLSAICADNLIFRTNISSGTITGAKDIHKFGSSLVGTTIQPITLSGNYETPMAAVSLEFVSDDINDTAAGSGARSITIQGLGADWLDLEQVIATNGTTPVTIPIAMTRLHRWFVSPEGSGTYATQLNGSHVGNLTIQASGAGATWSTIPNSPFPFSQSQIGVYSIPLGRTGFILSKRIGVDATKVADIYLFQRPKIDVVVAPFEPMKVIERDINITSPSSILYETPLGPFVGPCDIGFMGRVNLATGTVSSEFELLLLDT